VAVFETNSFNKNFYRDVAPKDIDGSMERSGRGLLAGFFFDPIEAVCFDKSTAMLTA
jgi:hypothetical protein